MNDGEPPRTPEGETKVAPAHATGQRQRIARQAVSWALALLALGAYFFQSATLGPNHTDDGLILGYIDDMARGQLPFYDFVDAYGLFNWVFPVLFYKAAGLTVWGVRLWMVVLKVATIVVVHRFVRALSREPPGTPLAAAATGDFHALLASLFMAVLLGAQWQSLQTAYAFLTVVPLVVGAWHLLLAAPLASVRRNVLAAGIVTAVAIWTKLNTGMFLFAGGLFAYFYWVDGSPADAPVPEKSGGEAPSPRGILQRVGPLLPWLAVLGAAAYALLFTAFMRKHFNGWFAVYLLLPLILGVAWTAFASPMRDLAVVARRFAAFESYLTVTGTLSILVLFGYYGRRAFQYARELAGILSSIKYTAPFPPVGKPGPYVGLNEYFWLQLPWLVTLSFAAWAALSRRFGPRAFGEAWPRRRAQVSSLFVLVTLHSFVMYARADETHIYQAVVLAVPALFVLLAQLDAFLGVGLSKARPPLRAAFALLALWYCKSLFVVPTASAFAIGPGEWHNPKLEHLRYRSEHSRYVRDFSPHLTDHDWDETEDEAAAYVQSVSEPDEEVLLLNANRLVYLNSNTRPVGGRYHFFFYLVSVGLLDREGFDGLVPPEVVRDIEERPPRVIVSSFGFVPLALQFPEFAHMRDKRYERTHTFRHIWVYELRQHGRPVPAPLR